MTTDGLDHIKCVLSAPGSLDILLLTSSGPCTKTDVYRLLNGSRNISDTLDVLERNELISIDRPGDDTTVSLTYRGAMLTDLLRWAEMLLRCTYPSA